ncbi:ATP-binding cassette domain-containing protein [Nocardia sp. NPDC006630]|uniref:ATP-binding cassette domain-containing protein n=1 Tax=Nocardia sp. NPDC006630 TaxID=3157181 RepID=UPI0033AC470F
MTALAALAALAGIGLLSLSGWFLAACALAGAGLLPGFGYYLPSGAVRALALARIGAHYGERLGAHAVALDWRTRIRLRLFDDLAAAPTAVQRECAHSDALDRIMNDAESVDNLVVSAVIPLCATVIALAAGCGALLWAAPAAAAICASGAIAAAVVAIIAGRARHTLSAELAAARGAARTRIAMIASAAPELVCLGAAEQLHRDLRSLLARLDGLEARTALCDRRAVLCIRLIGTGMVAAVAFWLHSGPMTPALPTATLVALVTIQLAEQLEALAAISRQTVESATAAERLAPLRGAEEPGIERPRPMVAVSFAPGSTTVLSGASGIGKTTALRDIAANAATPHTLIPVWHDDPVFTGTVAENLRLGAPALTDTDAQLLLDDFGLTDLRPGTRVGTGARTLSHGETRRLTIARAVAAHPRILLLDEPTEGLDPGHIRRTFEAIRRRLPEAAVIAAVHDRHHAHLPNYGVQHLRLDQAGATGNPAVSQGPRTEAMGSSTEFR